MKIGKGLPDKPAFIPVQTDRNRDLTNHRMHVMPEFIAYSERRYG
jgi:hypothetical protein